MNNFFGPIMTVPVCFHRRAQFRPRSTVYATFRDWRRYGVFDRIHPALLMACREGDRREAGPTGGSMLAVAVGSNNFRR